MYSAEILEERADNRYDYACAISRRKSIVSQTEDWNCQYPESRYSARQRFPVFRDTNTESCKYTVLRCFVWIWEL
jgi:hypothetical protein